jgi:hypothetical protein
MSQEPQNELPGRLKDWVRRARSRGSALFRESFIQRWGQKFGKRFPKGLDITLGEEKLKNVTQYASRIQWGLLVLGTFLLADLTGRGIALFIRPTFAPVPRKAPVAARRPAPSEDYEAIVRRNMFNVETAAPGHHRDE